MLEFIKNQLCFLIYCSLICHHSIAQVELKGSIGPTYNFGLDELNAELQNQTIRKLNPVSFSGGFSVSLVKNNSRTFIQFNGGAIQNHESLPSTSIRLNNFSLSLNYAHNLTPQKKQLKVEPFVGFGVNYLELFIWTHDTTSTFTGLLNGDQNLHYERSSISTQIQTGLSLSYFPEKFDNRIHLFSSINYQHQINPFKWKTSNVPLNFLHAISLQVGIGFHLKRNRN